MQTLKSDIEQKSAEIVDLSKKVALLSSACKAAGLDVAGILSGRHVVSSSGRSSLGGFLYVNFYISKERDASAGLLDAHPKSLGTSFFAK